MNNDFYDTPITIPHFLNLIVSLEERVTNLKTILEPLRYFNFLERQGRRRAKATKAHGASDSGEPQAEKNKRKFLAVLCAEVC